MLTTYTINYERRFRFIKRLTNENWKNILKSEYLFCSKLNNKDCIKQTI